MTASPNRPITSIIETGILVLVAGPSGAGKDTLMAGARDRLAGDPRIVFARRIITRRGGDDTECHDHLPVEDFDRAEAGGEFLLSWRAHGLGYAIPGSARGSLWAGKVLVANVSRTVIGQAERAARHVTVVHVTAPLHQLAARIAARGREPVEAIAERLARQPKLVAERATITEIVNDGAIETAADALAETLRQLADRTTGSAR